jgi:hypothetical protein
LTPPNGRWQALREIKQDPGSVESLLGQPNFEAGRRMPGDSILWHYYAADGTAVFLPFIRDQLAIAKYERKDLGVGGKPVASVERELAGRNIYKVTPDPPQRRISPQLIESVKQGLTRSEVVAALGEPSGGMAIAGGESDYEDMTYLLDPTGEILLHLEKGKVVRISK